MNGSFVMLLRYVLLHIKNMLFFVFLGSSLPPRFSSFFKQLLSVVQTIRYCRLCLRMVMTLLNFDILTKRRNESGRL